MAGHVTIKNVARRAILLMALAFCTLFAWALLIAGGIACLARIAGWPWPLIAIACAILHLAGAFALAKVARSKIPTAFPVTRAEFLKDREWIETLQPTKKSND